MCCADAGSGALSRCLPRPALAPTCASPQADSYLEALRLAGLRLRDSEEMGRRPPNVPDLTALRRLERHGWKTMLPLVKDFDEAKVLTEPVLALEGKERVRGYDFFFFFVHQVEALGPW